MCSFVLRNPYQNFMPSWCFWWMNHSTYIQFQVHSLTWEEQPKHPNENLPIIHSCQHWITVKRSTKTCHTLLLSKNIRPTSISSTLLVSQTPALPSNGQHYWRRPLTTIGHRQHFWGLSTPRSSVSKATWSNFNSCHTHILQGRV